MTSTTLSRRSFLKVASLASGGLMLGFRLPAANEAASPEPFEPNAWLRITPDGIVTVIYGRAEMGQGSSTALPMIVAEELEADWEKVRWEQADAHPSKYGNMTTGGSQSVRRFWVQLRTAGATAKAMLINAAAQSWGVDPGTCRARLGIVTHPSGKSATYGERVTITTRIDEWHRKAFIQKHTVTRGEDLICESLETRVFCVRDTQDRRRIHAIVVPEDIRRMCE